MENYQKMIWAIQIFVQYVHPEEMAASHDVIYWGPDPEIVSQEDTESLEELGWHPCPEYGCFLHYT